MSIYQQNENSQDQEIELYTKELVAKTIPNIAMDAFNSLGDIEKYVSNSVLSHLESELQKFRETL